MKKILYMYHASNIGGGTYCLLNILKALDRSKITPIVMLCYDGPLTHEITKLGIDVIFFPQMSSVPYNQSMFIYVSFKKYFKLIFSQKKFKKLLTSLNLDAVYINTIVLAPYLKACKEIGLKTIIHIREHWPLNEHTFQLHFIQSCIQKYADQVIAINSYSASIIPSKEVSIIYDWIDFSERYKYFPFDDIFHQVSSKLKVYLYTGGDQTIKGFYEVIFAFVNFIKGDNCRLLLLGVPSMKPLTGFKGFIKKICYFWGYDKKRRLAYKMIESDSRIVQIDSTYAIKHIFQQVYCNLSYFTIPHANLALAEGIILNTISVASRNEESLEYSNNGELAVLFDPNDFNDFVRAIKQVDLCYNDLKQKLLSDQSVAAMFDKDTNIKKLSEIYSNLFN